MLFNDICLLCHIHIHKIRSHSYSECLNELTLKIRSSKLNGILLVIPMAQKQVNFLNKKNSIIQWSI